MTRASRISARHLTRRAFALTGVLVLALATAGCGDSEADQRKAFIKFLDDINHRVGVHFLVPTQEDRVAFGDYMRHYTVILDFNKDMKIIFNDYSDALKKNGNWAQQPGADARANGGPPAGLCHDQGSDDQNDASV